MEIKAWNLRLRTIFDTDAVKRTVHRASRKSRHLNNSRPYQQPHPRADECRRRLDRRIRLEGGANAPAAARKQRGVVSPWWQSVAFLMRLGLDRQRSNAPAIDASLWVAADAQDQAERLKTLPPSSNIEGIAAADGLDGPGTGFTCDGDVAQQVRQCSFDSSAMAKASGRGCTLMTRRSAVPLRSRAK